MQNPENTVIINLKHYRQSSSAHAERFIEGFVGMETVPGVKIIFALNPIDLRLASSFPEFEFYSQHVDPVEYGAHTGQFSPQSLLDLGVTGTILNHSERRIPEDILRKTVDISRRCGLRTVVCCENAAEASRFAPMKPDWIAYEPPELIGGNVSVTTSRPEIISDVVDTCSRSGVAVIVGAGVKTPSDYRTSLKLGANGVLIASGIILAMEPAKTLSSLIENQ